MNKESIQKWNEVKEQVAAKHTLYNLGRSYLDEKEAVLFNDFSFPKIYSYTHLRKGLGIANKSKEVRIYLYETSYNSGLHSTLIEDTHDSYNDWDYQLLGALKTKETFQNVLIQQQTLAHRLKTIFTRKSIYLQKHPTFSKEFDLISANEEDIIKLANKGFLEEIVGFPHYTIELSGQWLMINTKKRFTPEIALELAEFLLRLREKGI